MYAVINFKTKKELKEAVKEGRQIGVFQAGPFPATQNGTVCIEGPHYPAMHTFYASAVIKDGIIQSVK